MDLVVNLEQSEVPCHLEESVSDCAKVCPVDGEWAEAHNDFEPELHAKVLADYCVERPFFLSVRCFGSQKQVMKPIHHKENIEPQQHLEIFITDDSALAHDDRSQENVDHKH